jgi:hypothetical protein
MMMKGKQENTMTNTERLAKWLYEHHGTVYHDNDYKQIPWAEIGYMVKDEYLKEAKELLDVFRFNDMHKTLKEALEILNVHVFNVHRMDIIAQAQKKAIESTIAKAEGK